MKKCYTKYPVITEAHEKLLRDIHANGTFDDAQKEVFDSLLGKLDVARVKKVKHHKRGRSSGNGKMMDNAVLGDFQEPNKIGMSNGKRELTIKVFLDDTPILESKTLNIEV